VPKLVKLRWKPALGSELPRRERKGCEYEAYVPDLLVGRSFTLQGEIAADIADAERAVERLNAEAASLVDSEAIARLLLRAEAVASSRIEGLEVGGRRLLRAQLAVDMGEEPRDVTAVDVLNNIEAMHFAVNEVSSAKTISVGDILAIHERLLRDTGLDRYAGELRTQQNWIGGSSYNPCSAVFVPPPHDRVEALLEDLCEFASGDALPALAQAAIAHAQFETIHPFVDGNGRTGRALIHVILRRRGLAPVVVPPLSLVLATWADSYVAGLTATRHNEPPDSPKAAEATNRWLELFAYATMRSVAEAEAYERRVAKIQDRWRERLGRVRADSAIARLIEALPGAPVVTVQSAAELIGRSEQAVNDAIPRLLEARVLRQTTVGRRNRAFEASDLLRAFTDLERQLASPEGETRFSPPERRVPYRATG
jgi:Fic family protein